VAGNRFLGSITGLQIWALVETGHKNTNAPLILKFRDIIFFTWANYIMGHFSGYFEGASTFLTLKIAPRCARDTIRVKKVLAPPEISLEMAHYVICPQKKNNIPHFQNQRCINSYNISQLVETLTP
jgi:hypothetical protein